MFKKLQRLFHDIFYPKAKQQRRHFQEWQRTRPPLPDLPVTELAPAVNLVQQPIPYVPGLRLALDRAKRGLHTVRLVPLQHTDGFSALPTASALDARLADLHELLDGYAETEKLPRVKAP